MVVMVVVVGGAITNLHVPLPQVPALRIPSSGEPEEAMIAVGGAQFGG